MDTPAAVLPATRPPPAARRGPTEGRQDPLGRARIIGSLVVIGFYVLAATFGPILLKYDPVATDLGARLKPPGSPLAARRQLRPLRHRPGRSGHARADDARAPAVSITVGVATLLLAGRHRGRVPVSPPGYFGSWLDVVLLPHGWPTCG